MDDIGQAIKLLKSNGYIVKKITDSMKEDSKKCEAQGYDGDCSGCSCNICIGH